ncbi:kinase-like domain-containing protein, partial [Mycena alexandri]
REAELWAQLKHVHLVPFLGISTNIGPCPFLISPFYPLGHIGTFLSKRPNANRPNIVLGVASGLEYLHAHEVVHGDLKVQNVLVDESGTPFICDFGISKIINRRGFTTDSVGTLSYMAPELLIAFDLGFLMDQPSTTKSSDVYSFGLLVLEVRGGFPFAPKRGPPRFFMSAKDIGSDLCPKRVDYSSHLAITDKVWSILEPCWALDPKFRPNISKLRDQLAAAFAR